MDHPFNKKNIYIYIWILLSTFAMKDLINLCKNPPDQENFEFIYLFYEFAKAKHCIASDTPGVTLRVLTFH